MSTAQESLHVLVDGAHLGRGAKGVGLYTARVLEHLAQLDPELRCTVLHLDRETPPPLDPRFHLEPTPWRNHLWHGFVTLPRAIRRHRPAVVWMPNETPVDTAGRPFVMIAHDVPRALREAQAQGSGMAHRPLERLRDRVDDWLLGRTLRRATHLGVNSRWVGDQLVDLHSVDPARLASTPCAPADDFAGMAKDVDRAAVRRRLGFDDGYVLTFFTGDWRENPAVVPEVFERLHRTRPILGLVVAGIRPGQESQARALYDGRPWRERVRFHPFLDADHRVELAGLYTAAEAYFDPSLQEGFGMQVVEAMACGTPVVCGDRGALPEVTDGHALLVDPLDVEAMAEALDGILAHDERRQALVDAARRRAAEFDWRQTAETLLHCLRRAARGNA